MKSAEIACTSLFSPPHGNVVVDGSGVGTVATYSCDTGYTLEGESTRTCQNSADPTWSGSPPTCNSELPIHLVYLLLRSFTFPPILLTTRFVCSLYIVKVLFWLNFFMVFSHLQMKGIYYYSLKIPTPLLCFSHSENLKSDLTIHL